jgi:hypothetical protein
MAKLPNKPDDTMPASEKKKIASRRNGGLSQGPKSAVGRLVSSRNATSHGILSRELVLPSERREDFDALFERLLGELGAVGTLECILVERVAVAMWRQRRLVRAETAGIQLRQIRQDEQVGGFMPVRYQSDVELIAEVVESMARTGQLESFAQELALLGSAEGLGALELERRFPLIVQFFKAGSDLPEGQGEMSIDTIVSIANAAKDKYLSAIDRHRSNQSLAALRTEALGVPAATDNLARYQSAIDNELYKALRALREAQAWRRKSMEIGVQGGDDEVGGKQN